MTSALAHIEMARMHRFNLPLIRAALMVAGITLLSVAASQFLTSRETIFSKILKLGDEATCFEFPLPAIDAFSGYRIVVTIQCCYRSAYFYRLKTRLLCPSGIHYEEEISDRETTIETQATVTLHRFLYKLPAEGGTHQLCLFEEEKRGDVTLENLIVSVQRVR